MGSWYLVPLAYMLTVQTNFIHTDAGYEKFARMFLTA